MIKDSLQQLLRRLGYEIQHIDTGAPPALPVTTPAPPALEPTWPLPRRAGGPSDSDIRDAFAKFDSWQYAYRFEGGLALDAHHKGRVNPVSDAPERPLQRFRHFMPYVVASQGGSLKGKRVLDISCNSGFWSMQCALLGADVVGFDVRPELIEQANLIKGIVGVENVEYKVLDYWDMSPETLGGTFDVVLNLGVLYHLSKTIEAMELAQAVSRGYMLLDTGLYRSSNPVIKMLWEEPHDIQMAGHAGIVGFPSKRAVEMILRHIGVQESVELPHRTTDLPPDYLNGRRASWLIKV